MPSILLWRLGALGDSLLLLPALAACRAAFPRHEIVVVGAREAFAPAMWSRLADRVVDGSSPALALLAAGQAAPQGILPSDIALAVAWTARPEALGIGLQRSGAQHVITAPILPAARLPVAEHYMAALAAAGVQPVPFQLDPPPHAHTETDTAWRTAAGGAGGPVALLHPGAGSRLKRWPLEGYLSLAALLRRDGTAVVWTAGPADLDVRAALGAAGEGHCVLPPLDVAGLSGVLRRAAVVVSGDCGVAHLAALLAVPGVALFGPTDPILWGPPGAHTSVLRLGLPCSPCDEVARACPTRICLGRLPVAAVYAAVQARLNAGTVSGDTGPRPGPSRPATWCPPASAGAPPGALPVQRWEHARRWGAGQPIGPV